MWRALTALALGTTMAGGVMAEDTHKGYEMPPYTVEATDGAREIRSYGPHLLAEVRVSGGRQGAIQAGFRVLAGYIFGGNDGGRPIAMTAPVLQDETQPGEWRMRFVMPSKYTLETLPPAPADITLTQTPARRMAGLPSASTDRCRSTRWHRRW